MSDFNFKAYSRAKENAQYDGFIGPDGAFYRVKLKFQDKYDEKATHYTWAEAFVKEKLDYQSLRLDPHYSTIYMLSKLSTPLDLLIHHYGFVYYSHEHVLHKPIVIAPKGEFGPIANNTQLNVLWEIMLQNNEHPELEPIFYEDDEPSYGGRKL